MYQKIKEFLDQFNKYNDDYDGKSVYAEKINPFSAFFLKVFGNISIKPDRRKRTFGRIKGNVFSYVTFPMIFVFGMLIWAVIAAFANLLPYYETNIFLNGLIISFMIYGILKTFHNSYMLYKTACFFRLIETTIRKDVVPQEDIYKLRRSLERDGHLVNTVVMVDTIDNIEKFGHPNFNDHRARLIKSKMGFRVSKSQGNVSYIAGILVMLGLLGTFLGLLATIDSVGAALGGMSDIGGDTGEVGVEDMSTFIGSLAKPLEGMGLAFSSSLFGLSGSLLIGFFLYLAGTPQNNFMENISRWIDDRIPTHNPAKIKEVAEAEKKNNSDNAGKESAKEINPNEKINAPVKDQDLKDWLSGHVYMSVKMNNLIKNLCAEISSSTAEIQKVTDDNQLIRNTQTHITEAMNSTNILLQNIEGHNQSVSEVIPAIVSNGKMVSAYVQEMQTNQITGNNILTKMNNQMSKMSEALQINETISQQLNHNAKLVSDLIENNQKQSLESGQYSAQTLELLNKIKVISEGSETSRIKFMELQMQAFAQAENSSNNIQNVMEGALNQNSQAIQEAMGGNINVMQEGLGRIAVQIDTLGNQLKSEEVSGNIKAIESFVAELNSTQKELVKSMQMLSQEMANDGGVKVENKTLMKKIEHKINQLDETLRKFLKK